MSKHLVIALAVTVPAVLGGFLLLKQNNLNKNGDELREQAASHLSVMKAEDSQYVQQQIDKCHGKAFKAAVKSTGLLSPAEIDEDLYQRALFTLVLDAARSEKRDSVVNQLENDLKLMGGAYQFKD